jgi:cytochrome c oxidase assembly protein subunit 15
MQWAEGFTVLRELGRAGHGGYLGADALVAIHMAHRLFALVLVVAVVALALALWRSGGVTQRRYALAWAVLLGTQVASGLSNVVLGWPLVAALGHSAGAAAMVALATSLLARSHAARARATDAPVPVAPPRAPVAT